jgi:hypothetical protein
MTFNRLVFWSGIWNVGLGLILITPPITQFLGVHIPNPLWPWMIAAFLWFTSATLILSSCEVQNFASIIYWDALLRFSAAVILLAYGFKYLGVLPTVLFAITDFSWGVILIIGLQRATGRSHASLLLNRRVGSDQTNSSVAGRDKSA